MADEKNAPDDLHAHDDFDGDEPTGDIPDLLAHALIVPDPGVVEEPTPTSVVDEWAFSDDEHRLDDDDELTDRISSMPGLGDDTEGPSMTTLRPSAVTLRPKQIERRSREPWLLAAAVVALGAGAWLTLGRGAATPPAAQAASEAIEADVADAAEVARADEGASRQGVRLRTSSDGVMAIVEGESWGPLPVSLSHLAPGAHRIRFEAPGYHTLEREVVVEEGRTVDLDVALEPKPVQVVLEVEPPNAFVLLSDSGNLGDGRRFPGPWPRILELEPGTYTFVAFRAGFGTLQRQVEIEPGPKASAVRFELPAEDVYE